jgi:outer membrane protein OmpA-like peptidoglycan-associated protein
VDQECGESRPVKSKEIRIMKRMLIMSAMILVFSIDGLSQAAGDARRHTIAVTYLRDPVNVRFAGTTLRPDARGEATVERWRKRNETEIDIRIENLIPPYNYGADYTTYVLWAVTPAGQAANLGEFRLTNGSGRLKAATPHQRFAMIVTAEPHYLVRLPSRIVVLENLAPVSRNVQIEVTEVFFTGDSGKFYTDNTVPQIAERDYNKIPMELLQARRAVQIARLADAERYDPGNFTGATRSLAQAEGEFQRGANVHQVGRIARDAILLAARARDVAEERAEAAARRMEIARRDEEVRRATETASDLGDQLLETRTRLSASEIARKNVEDQLSQALRDAAEARAENRSLKSDNTELRTEVGRLNRELADARTQITTLQSQLSSTSSRLSEAAGRAETMERLEKERAEAEARRRDFANLQSAVSRVVPAKPSGSGFTVVLPDSFFVTNRAQLALRVKSKMDALAEAIAAYPNVDFAIEGHSDQRPNADNFAGGRAQAVADYLFALGVSSSRVRVESRGATSPVSSLRTARGKALNRRVELIFTAPR